MEVCAPIRPYCPIWIKIDRIANALMMGNISANAGSASVEVFNTHVERYDGHRSARLLTHLLSRHSSAPWPCTCPYFCMESDDAVVRSFIQRLDSREMNGTLNLELAKLSYEQLLRVSQILAKRIEKELK